MKQPPSRYDHPGWKTPEMLRQEQLDKITKAYFIPKFFKHLHDNPEALSAYMGMRLMEYWKPYHVKRCKER